MALAVDTTSHATATGSGGATLSWSHTTGSSANKLVVTIGSAGASRDISGVTFNSVALTKLIDQDDGSFENAEIWRLNDPPIGTFTIEVSFSGGGGAQQAAGAISFSGAAAAERDTSVATGAGANPSVAVDSESGDYCVDAYASDLGSDGTSTPGGTTIWEDEDVASGDSDFGSQYVVASGASTSPTWTAVAPSSGSWALVAASIKAAGGTPATHAGPSSGGRRRTRYGM